MNVSVKRIERYLAARKKRRQLAQAWIHWINEGEGVEADAELRTEDISSLLEQRTELLEALKGMKDAFCNPESGEIDKRLAVQDMNITITKAEASE